MLLAPSNGREKIVSIIAIGNLDMDRETFGECDRSWLMIPTKEGRAFALEPTNGQVYLGKDIKLIPKLRQYWSGYYYTKPSDLKADIKDRW